MSYTQLRTPNFSVKGKAGWCLSVQDDVWAVPHASATAHAAYDAAQFKHPNEQPPAGIDALCYWTYSGDGDAWHVATRAKDGRVFSSPFSVSYGNEWFASIDAMTARIRKLDPNCVYVGWVEDLSNVRLVQGDNDMIAAGDIAPVRVVMSEVEGWDGNEIHSGKDDTQIMSAWQGHSWQEFIMHGWTVQATHRQNLVDSINTLNAAVAEAKQSAATLLADDNATKAQLQAALAKVAELEKVPTPIPAPQPTPTTTPLPKINTPVPQNTPTGLWPFFKSIYDKILIVLGIKK